MVQRRENANDLLVLPARTAKQTHLPTRSLKVIIISIKALFQVPKCQFTFFGLRSVRKQTFNEAAIGDIHSPCMQVRSLAITHIVQSITPMPSVSTRGMSPWSKEYQPCGPGLPFGTNKSERCGELTARQRAGTSTSFSWPMLCTLLRPVYS